MTGLTASFGKPFAFQVAAFRLRLAQLQPSFTWTDVWKSEHDRAFMVAGAVKADILADIAAMVDKAVTQGTTLEEFRRDFRAMVAAKGWQISKAGQGTKKGEAWRTKVIYKTNMATSYAAGRWAQLMQAGYPFIVYSHGGSLHPREQHLAWDGLVLEVDHPFWATHAPPNGWGCSCFVSGARSREAAKRVGGKPEKLLPDGWQKSDPKTGAPVGIDKGWDYAPGGSVADTVASLSRRLDLLPERPSIDLIQSWLHTDAFATWLKSPVGLWPAARIAEAERLAIGSETAIAKLSPETMLKQDIEHPELTIFEYMSIQDVVDRATIKIPDRDRSVIYVARDPAKGGFVLVIKATMSGKELFITSFRRLSRNEVKRDEALRRLLRKRKGL